MGQCGQHSAGGLSLLPLVGLSFQQLHCLGPQVASSVLENRVTGLCDGTSFPPKIASISKATHGTFCVAACSLDPF